MRALNYFTKVLLLFISVICFQSITFAQDSVITITTKAIGDWNVRCEQIKGGEKSCVMMQQSFAKSSGQRVIQSNIAKVDGGSLMSILLPLGIYLPAGATIQFDEQKPTKFLISFCDRDGCFVNQKVDKKLLGQLKKSKSAKITIEVNEGQVVDVPFSVNGFTAAFDAL